MPEKSPFPQFDWQEEYLTSYLKVMNLWGVEYESYEVETSFGTTHINICGPENAPPVILLHAASVSSVEWYANAAVWSEHFRLFAVDTIGDCGWSRSSKVPQSREDYNQWLLEVMAFFQMDKAHIIGHSYGGWLALNFAVSHGEKLDKIVLLAPAASIQPFKLLYKLALKMPRLPVNVSTEKLLKMMASQNYEPNPDFLRLMDTVNHHCRPKMLFPTVYSDEELQSISCPVFLILGDQESIYSPIKAMERARKLIKNLKYEIILQAGHTLNMEQPKLVNTKVLKFLRE